MVILLAFATSASGTTYYIAASGSDTNSGTSSSSAWLHAPGMNGCSSNCASVTPQPGDRFIFRGGDTWHRSTGTPKGLDWAWTWSGTLANPIYVGVDKTWFAGAAWSRPVLNIDNPLSTSVVGSCTYDNSGGSIVTFSNAHYITLDNFEMKGFCWSGGSGNHIDRANSTYIVLSNLYIHGWSHTSGFTDTAWMIHGNSGGATHNSILDSTIDGSDSPYRSGFAVYGDCYELGRNTFRYLSNGSVCWNPTLIHDNLFEYIIETTDNAGTHGNVLEEVGGHSGTGWFYNNVVRHTTGGGIGLGVNVWLNVSSTQYIYNNIFYDIGNPQGCLKLNNQQGNSSRNTTNIWNNTFDAPCTI